MLQAEYYILESENNENYPLFSWDQMSGKYGLGKPIPYNNEPLKMRLGDPIPKNIEWADIHSAPEIVVSKKIAEVLVPFKLYGIQLVPTVVRDPRDPFSAIKPYYFLHIWNRVACLDRELSELDIDEDDGQIWDIEKLVMDERILNDIDINKRLIFELGEKTSITFVHESIKDIIMAINPTGFRFISAMKWNSDSMFN
jgi:hypothetical protein